MHGTPPRPRQYHVVKPPETIPTHVAPRQTASMSFSVPSWNPSFLTCLSNCQQHTQTEYITLLHCLPRGRRGIPASNPKYSSPLRACRRFHVHRPHRYPHQRPRGTHACPSHRWSVHGVLLDCCRALYISIVSSATLADRYGVLPYMQ